MAGDTANTSVWSGADVYVADVGSTAPVDLSTALDVAFEPVGLLDGEEGLVEAREEDVNDHAAWGVGIIKTTRRNHKRTFAFTALEDNAVTHGLVNPSGSTVPAAAVDTRTVKVPSGSDERAWVFELREGDKTKRIAIPRAEVTEVGDREYTEDGLAMLPLTVTVYAAADGTLYTELVEGTGV